MATREKKTKSDDTDDRLAPLRAAIERLQVSVSELTSKVNSQDAKIAQASRGAPQAVAHMSAQQVEQSIRDNRSAEFEVVSDYKKAGIRLGRGHTLSAQTSVDLLAHVRNGLRLTPAA